MDEMLAAASALILGIVFWRLGYVSGLKAVLQQPCPCRSGEPLWRCCDRSKRL